MLLLLAPTRRVVRLLTPVVAGLLTMLVPARGNGQSLAAATAPYWQQQVAYSIDVRLDDRRHELTGTEELTYTNNSPDALPFIWLHLWPNAYRDNHTAYARQQLRSGSRKFQFAPDSARGFIDQLAFTADGVPAALEFDPSSPDMARLLLPRPLAAGAQVVLRTPFRVKLPYTFSRGGHVGQTYQISQWYPKPAVYDRAGWHPMPYLDQGEFYSEFGSFDVRLTVPANYVVAATGVLQNPEEQAFLDSLAARSALTLVRPAPGRPVPPRQTARAQTPASAPQTKTLRYVQDRIHDFAWFADKRYLALKSSVTLPQSGRQVATWLFFPADANATQWVTHRADIDAAVLGYSRLVGEYPYTVASAVAGPLGPGSGGMEYPMVTITEPDAIIHEVGHNWFYGILGSNERDYPWLDESINSYTEDRVVRARDSSRVRAGEQPLANQLAPGFQRLLGFTGLPPTAVEDLPWQMSVSRGLNQAIGLRATDFSATNYGNDLYQRAPALLRYLAAYLGQARFDSCMHAYYRQWQFRHPYPADILNVFEKTSGESLTWFFRDLLTSRLRSDVALARVRIGSDSIRVQVLNEGDSLLAVPIATVDAQGHVLAQRWTPLFREQGLLSLPLDPAARAVVADPYYLLPTVRRADDKLRLRGPLRSLNAPRLRPLLGPERWDQAPLYWAPLAGANTTDKFMLGAWFSTSSLVQRRLRVSIAPLYSFSRNQLNGYGEVAFSVLPPGRAAEVTTAFRAARFADYLKLEPALTVHFRPQHAGKTSIRRQSATVGLTTIRRDRIAGDDASGSMGAARWVRYDLGLGNALNRFEATAEFYNYYASALAPRLGPTTRFDGANLLRVALRGEHYYSRHKALKLRMFGGRFVGRSQDFIFMGLSGSPDYLRQSTFLDRAGISQMLAAGPRQTDDRDGGFHAWVPVFSNHWLASASLEAAVPKVPFSVYGDVGAARGATKAALVPQTTTTYYGAGLVLTLAGTDVLRVYLPVAGSSFANGRTPGSWGEFTSNIRFALKLESLAPERQLRKLLE